MLFSGTHSDFDNVNNTLIVDIYSHSRPLIYGEFDNDILSFDAKVGIGTIQPNAPLHIKGGSDVSLGLGTGQIILGNEDGTNLAMDNNEIQARNNGATSTLYLQLEGGDVNVGGAMVHASDRRLKEDIEDLTFGLDHILQLRPTEYFWIGKEKTDKSLGLIAQEVEGVIKNVVTYNEAEDRYGVSYTELIPILIKAIQEQQEIIKLQEKQTDNQNTQIENLEARLSKLERMMLAINSDE